MSAVVTIEGNLAYDPELQFTSGGKAKCRLTVISSGRQQNKDTREWEDVDVTAWSITAWDSLAENIAGSLGKGDGVVVVGKALQERWEDKDTGAKRSAIVIKALNVGVSLKRVTTVSSRPVTSGSSGGARSAAVVEDPWAAATRGAIPPARVDDPWATSQAGSEPPF